MRSLESLLKPPKPTQRDPIMRETFLEFIEKLAILDVIFEPFLEENFMQYNVFPYDH